MIPRQEINSAERDKFWAAEEEAERKRQAEEARIREEKQRLAELERHRREVIFNFFPLKPSLKHDV